MKYILPICFGLAIVIAVIFFRQGNLEFLEREEALGMELEELKQKFGMEQIGNSTEGDLSNKISNIISNGIARIRCTRDYGTGFLVETDEFEFELGHDEISEDIREDMLSSVRLAFSDSGIDVRSSKVDIMEQFRTKKEDGVTEKKGETLKKLLYYKEKLDDLERGIVKTKYAVLTDNHFVKNHKRCLLDLSKTNDIKSLTRLTIYPSVGFSYNNFSGSRVVRILGFEHEHQELNYGIGKINTCSQNHPIGSVVYATGYRIISITTKEYDPVGHFIKYYQPIVRAGIISSTTKNNNKEAFDNYFISPVSPVSEYFDSDISEYFDSGMSGGPAFSKDKDGICLLGMNSYFLEGKYANQQGIENIHNIFYTK